MSALRILGINPMVAALIMMFVFLSGIMIGLWIKNAAKKPALRPQPAKERREIQEPAPEDIKVPEEKEAPEENPEPAKPETATPTQFIRNALAMPDGANPPLAAIIIDDMGIDMARSNRILMIDAPLTVSYMPHAPNLQAQIDTARSKGKEAMLHVPMEAMSSAYANDYGPEYLKTTESRQTNARLLREMLERANGYVGVNNHMGSKFTLDEGQMSGVLEELARRGLAFIDSKTAATSLGPIARHLKMPFLERDVFLDDSNEPEDIKARFADLERIAKKRGWAVAIGHPREATIKALAEWLDKESGVIVVPVSYIITKYD
jgi:polysaccharide deacetylase 2 family uncharacterized protein YibQ